MYKRSIEKETLSGLYDAIDMLNAADFKLGLPWALEGAKRSKLLGVKTESKAKFFTVDIAWRPTGESSNCAAVVGEVVKSCLVGCLGEI